MHYLDCCNEVEVQLDRDYADAHARHQVDTLDQCGLETEPSLTFSTSHLLLGGGSKLEREFAVVGAPSDCSISLIQATEARRSMLFVLYERFVRSEWRRISTTYNINSRTSLFPRPQSIPCSDDQTPSNQVTAPIECANLAEGRGAGRLNARHVMYHEEMAAGGRDLFR